MSGRHRNETAFWAANRKRLRELWDEGYTAAQIGLALGVSRCAVLSKVRSQGFPMRRKGGGDERKRRPQPLPLLAEPAKPRPLPAPEPTPATAVTSLSIKKGQCYWPLNDGAPRWLHCGAAAEGGLYCEHHRRRSIGGGTRGERDAA